MSSSQAISLDFRPVLEPATQADTYSITPDTISITNTGEGRASVNNDIEAVLRKIEYWHQASIGAFKIVYRDEHGIWEGKGSVGTVNVHHSHRGVRLTEAT
jgi:hypothetical protein